MPWSLLEVTPSAIAFIILIDGMCCTFCGLGCFSLFANMPLSLFVKLTVRWQKMWLKIFIRWLQDCARERSRHCRNRRCSALWNCQTRSWRQSHWPIYAETWLIQQLLKVSSILWIMSGDASTSKRAFPSLYWFIQCKCFLLNFSFLLIKIQKHVSGFFWIF